MWYILRMHGLTRLQISNALSIVFDKSMNKSSRYFHYRPQRSWGKVIFSQASVILSTGAGACVVPGGVCGCRGGACVAAGEHAWLLGGVCGSQECILGGHAWLLGGGVVAGGRRAWDTARYGQWAGGTHPTGMHSCYNGCLPATSSRILDQEATGCTPPCRICPCRCVRWSRPAYPEVEGQGLHQASP